MQEEYIKRINKVLAFIDKNLDSELSLQSLAEVACYSPFHLHRLFKAITNEPLNAYITRKRIESAAILLVHKKELSVAEIAFKYGFTSNSIFSRTFKKVYGQSASQFRKSCSGNFSKIGKVHSVKEEYICNINDLKNWTKLNATVEIIERPEMNLAYLTQIGEKGIDKAFQRLVKWAQSTGLLDQSETSVCRVFHDSFKVTDAEKVRMSIGVLTSQLPSVKGEIGLTTLEKGKTIVGRFNIEPKEFEKAWGSLFLWMTEQGYKKADRSPFEIYHTNYNTHPEKKFPVDLCIPIDQSGRERS